MLVRCKRLASPGAGGTRRGRATFAARAARFGNRCRKIRKKVQPLQHRTRGIVGALLRAASDVMRLRLDRFAAVDLEPIPSRGPHLGTRIEELRDAGEPLVERRHGDAEIEQHVGVPFGQWPGGQCDGRFARRTIARDEVVRHEGAVGESPKQLVESRQGGGVVGPHHDRLLREIGLFRDPAGEPQPRGFTRVAAHVEIDARRQSISARPRDAAGTRGAARSAGPCCLSRRHPGRRRRRCRGAPR